jgi:hypothetical protein
MGSCVCVCVCVCRALRAYGPTHSGWCVNVNVNVHVHVNVNELRSGFSNTARHPEGILTSLPLSAPVGSPRTHLTQALESFDAAVPSSAGGVQGCVATGLAPQACTTAHNNHRACGTGGCESGQTPHCSHLPVAWTSQVEHRTNPLQCHPLGLQASTHKQQAARSDYPIRLSLPAVPQ